MSPDRSNDLSLKYQMFTPSGSKDIRITKFEFVAKTEILCQKNVKFFIFDNYCLMKSNLIMFNVLKYLDICSNVLFGASNSEYISQMGYEVHLLDSIGTLCLLVLQ